MQNEILHQQFLLKLAGRLQLSIITRCSEGRSGKDYTPGSGAGLLLNFRDNQLYNDADD